MAGEWPVQGLEEPPAGGTLNVWENQYNSTMTGYTDWIYPEFKGYYANVRWMQLRTVDGTILVTLDDPSLYVQVLKADSRAIQSRQVRRPPRSKGVHRDRPSPPTLGPVSRTPVSRSCMELRPWETSSTSPKNWGPKSQQNVAGGNYHGTVRFFFGIQSKLFSRAQALATASEILWTLQVTSVYR